jgi:predicted deacylase
MRAALLLLTVLAGCVGTHPRNPEWRQRKADAADAVSNGAMARPQWRIVGRSVEGRSLRALELGRGPRRVLWVGGIHGDEREGHYGTAQLPAAFLDTPGAAEAVTLTILEDVNPDGSARNTRGNRNGVDLNRNYPARNYLPGDGRGKAPLDQPESRALHDLILAVQPDLVVVAHAWRNDHFINFDGPALQYAELFARKSGFRVKASDTFAPTPGSLGSWVGRTMGKAILTLEYERGTDPAAAWQSTSDAILAVILGG